MRRAAYAVVFTRFRVDLHAGAHRAGQRHAAQIGALRRRWFRAHDRVEQRRHVFHEVLFVEVGLADDRVDDAALSRRNSTLPALMSRIAAPILADTVPAFGLGIFCARTRPSSLPSCAIMSGVATATSKSEKPALTVSMRSWSPTLSGPLRGLPSLVALGERDHAYRASGSVRQ